MRTIGQIKFKQALTQLDEDGVLDTIILISAASLRILGFRVYTHFIDLLVQKSYYVKKANESNYLPKYELEPIPVTIADFSMRIGTVEKDLCSFRHMIQPYEVYQEVEFKLDNEIKLLKIRPHNYVRKDCEEAIERLIQGSNVKYWQDLYSYHKQIEAIDLGMSREKLKFGPEKYLKFEG
ncbi:MAG: hypothetical protein JSV20_03480 [Candidatus Bathyarchaeota archaeon]|nr:MAG: hypothetical protein JSV20_03480 [Candidatus Bathyarchaeota archaeon]